MPHIPPEQRSPHGHIAQEYRAGRLTYEAARAREDDALPRCAVHPDRAGKFIIDDKPRCTECAVKGG